MNKIDEFKPPRYMPTNRGEGFQSYIDLETGAGFTVFSGQYKPTPLKKLSQKELEKLESAGIYCNCPEKHYSVIDIADEIIELIIGVSVAKSGLFKSWGAHTFIMYINDPFNTARDWEQDIMLDAAGHYRIEDRKKSNIVRPIGSSTISINNYKNYFYGKEEYLYTYSFIIDKNIGVIIKNKFDNFEERSVLPFNCALIASIILLESGLFPNIKKTNFPIDIKKYFDDFSPVNICIIEKHENNSYDLEVRH